MPPPSAPLLPSFRIQGFRAFRDLEIPRLGRVNLIVGKNNVGKTTLLEAIQIYAAGSEAPWEIRELLMRRQEIRRGVRESVPPLIDIDRAFFQPATHGSRASIALGPYPEDRQLWIQSGRLLADDNERVITPNTVFVADEDSDPVPYEREGIAAWQVKVGTLPARFVFHHQLSNFHSADFMSLRRREAQTADSRGTLTCRHLPARGINSANIGALWDSIVLTENERSTLQALRIIAPDIERISLVEDPRKQGSRYALIVRKTHPAPEPLHSMGDGMSRIFELALGLVSSHDGLFLIDEVENGVHYSAQEQLWRFIFEAASQLNVQVFATTHSWDCIAAFQKAASSHPEDGMLISLAQTDGGIKATVFNEGDLEIITRESIEVR
ncbi:AAA family ATPase [Corallococcus interemptor]|uniref:AAA family ATPase n=1 Tax=Corallococcus interemptor TaxID=2316720 RepID=UPI003D076325